MRARIVLASATHARDLNAKRRPAQLKAEYDELERRARDPGYDIS